MKYLSSAPIVAPTYKAPKNCRHGFIDIRGKCVLCGEPVPPPADPCTCPKVGLAALAGAIAIDCPTHCPRGS
jgi:hypothetical protein